MGDDARVGRHFREEIVGSPSTEDVGDERSQGIRAANAPAVPEISLPSVCGAAEVHPSQEFGIHFLPAAPEQVSAAAGASVHPVRTARTWRSRYEEVKQTLWRRPSCRRLRASPARSCWVRGYLQILRQLTRCSYSACDEFSVGGNMQMTTRALAIAGLLWALGAHPAAKPGLDLVIANGRIVDGSGSP